MQLPIPMTVLTGYLGSGKTTLLKALLEHPGMAGTAVIINEFGEVGLDDALIGSVQQEPVLLPSGCVCCAVGGDLVAALLDLHESVLQGRIGDIARVVLETTGLADPAPIAQTLVSDRDLFRIYRLDGIVATADAQHGLAQLDGAVEPAQQAAMADRIVITKTDLAAPAATESLIARLRALNPAAAIHTAIKGAIEPGHLFGLNAHEIRGNGDVARWLAAESYAAHDHDCAGAGCAHPGHHRAHAHLHGIGSFCLTFDRPLEARKLEFAIEVLRATYGAKLLRVKGLLDVIGHEQPFVIHGVQHVFYPVETLERWPGSDRRSRIVFITRDLDEQTVRKLFAPLLESPALAGAGQGQR